MLIHIRYSQDFHASLQFAFIRQFFPTQPPPVLSILQNFPEIFSRLYNTSSKTATSMKHLVFMNQNPSVTFHLPTISCNVVQHFIHIYSVLYEHVHLYLDRYIRYLCIYTYRRLENKDSLQQNPKSTQVMCQILELVHTHTQRHFLMNNNIVVLGSFRSKNEFLFEKTKQKVKASGTRLQAKATDCKNKKSCRPSTTVFASFDILGDSVIHLALI